jgi:hypothetical protein
MNWADWEDQPGPKEQDMKRGRWAAAERVAPMLRPTKVQAAQGMSCVEACKGGGDLQAMLTDECLKPEIFYTEGDAGHDRPLIEHLQPPRPHSSLGHRPPGPAIF